ncbi:hypothetical protein QE369_002082 [Agrobacterium larrymoorei]|uniref:Uncharacterized protein n=1 Tax=Agrobacterium larrymoorei TaxID=160699 RepID=A0AAJ2BLP5_9HYPH|nr:type IV secretion system protein [Agrobacterium larrymoorei]MDR6101885.1 hypothetical protein [Agrobacterium larrymoorei]
MNRYLTLALLCGASSVAPVNFAFICNAAAQETITPVEEPATRTAPSGQDDADETHDTVAIQQIMKIVELSRLIAGGISQLFSSAKDQKQVLDQIYDGQTGSRDVPAKTEEADREGGRGLREMKEGALNGGIEGPPAVVDAFNRFRTTFKLDDAFELKDDELLGKRMLAQLGAMGAVAASTAESSYKRANSSMLRLDAYIKALNGSQDLKTSIDINTRAVIELTQQTNESIRTQSAISSIISTYFMALASEASEKDWVEGLKEFNR